MKIRDIKVLDIQNPMGIDRQPYFSWKIESGECNAMQTAYCIKVLDEEKNICWNTGEIAGTDQHYIPYQGKELQSMTRYRAVITVWDNHGKQASADSCFETALLKSTEWCARWAESPITRSKGRAGFGNQPPATLFRKSFTLRGEVKKARLYATCHGIYHLYINGSRIESREFAPEHTVYEKYLCYQTYDVTSLTLHENVLGMYVGDGWYLCQQTLSNIKNMKHAHAILFQLEIFYADGSHECICSDDDVKVSYGPVCSSDLFAGEKYDANLIQEGWCTAGFDDSKWIHAKMASYGFDNLTAQPEGAVRPVRFLPVAAVLESPRGETILDFGQVIAGRISMRVREKKGTTVTLDHCEVLDRDGNYFNNILSAGGIGNGCDQRDQYISDGVERVYEPHFTFHGFRYVRVAGTGRVHPKNFTAIALSTEKENVGEFWCSDERLNRLYQNIRWSQRANMLSIPTDCPQREKAGWTGDMLVYSRTAMLNEDCTAFFTRWLFNMACDQDERGVIPMVVPNDGNYPALGARMNQIFGGEGMGTSAGWGDAAVIVPYQMYLVTGNTYILRQQYQCMKRWCDFIIREAGKKEAGSDSPQKEKQGNYLWNTGFHYGEWLVPSLCRGENASEGAKKSITETSLYTAPIFGWYSVNTFSRIAVVQNETEDAEYYGAYADKMKAAIQEAVIGRDGSMPVDLMGAYVLPIYFDLVPKETYGVFVERLLHLVEKNDNCLDTGFLGTPFLLDALDKIGREDIAYKILWQDKCPSWLYEIKNGATTIWESWNGYDENGNPEDISFNHYALGCVADWLFKKIGGIDTDTPGFKHLIIAPDVEQCGVSSARREFVTSQGKAMCSWKIYGDEFSHRFLDLDVRIPCNTTATIHFPDGNKCDVGSGHYNYHIELIN